MLRRPSRTAACSFAGAIALTATIAFWLNS